MSLYPEQYEMSMQAKLSFKHLPLADTIMVGDCLATSILNSDDNCKALCEHIKGKDEIYLVVQTSENDNTIWMFTTIETISALLGVKIYIFITKADVGNLMDGFVDPLQTTVKNTSLYLVNDELTLLNKLKGYILNCKQPAICSVSNCAIMLDMLLMIPPVMEHDAEHIEFTNIDSINFWLGKQNPGIKFPDLNSFFGSYLSEYLSI